jgi:flavin-dependent dehydrogenase
MFDVVIVGGGPSGSTCGAFLKKYAPELKVGIFEREVFPRDHVGESLLPAVCKVLEELGAWDKVEAANFPIKIGATYRWGATDDLWDFEFLPGVSFKDEERPATYEGQRSKTAFQVDRAIFDKILLDHAKELGCEVTEGVRILEVMKENDSVTGLKLSNGETVTSKHYVDGSGVSGIIRREFDVPVEYPSNLKNIAIWDYWQDAEWAVTLGSGGTRIVVMSLGYGWIWFIPISPTRTSVGFVVPLEYYKASGLKPEEIYRKALAEEPLISKLLINANCESNLSTTNDWSYIAQRLSGENWFMVGDSCGFADPILSAGLTLAMMGARQVAYSILAVERKEHDLKWLRDFYNESHRARIRQHVLFADFWYTSNGQFTDLIDNTAKIAGEAGLKLSPDEAFRWLGTGGFTHEDQSSPHVGGFAIHGVQALNQRFSQQKVTWQVAQNNIFKLNLDGVIEEEVPIFFEGKIWAKKSFRRDGKMLPKYGVFDIVMLILQKESEIVFAIERFRLFFMRNPIYSSVETGVEMALVTLETMIADGWVTAEYDPSLPLYPFKVEDEGNAIHQNSDMTTVRRVAT